MKYAGRCLLTAGFICFWITSGNFGQAQISDAPVQQKAQTNHAEPERIQPPAVAEGKQQGAAKNQERCDNPESKNGPDLCAQWVAANAARKSAELAQSNLNWTIASFFALSFTLIASAWAAFAAARAAKAALRSNVINQNAVNVDQRAWLSVEPLVLGQFQINQDGGASIHFGARIKNIGKTPAHKIRTNMELVCDIRLNNLQGKLGELASLERDNEHQWTRSLLPGESYVREWVPTQDNISTSFDGNHIIMPEVLICVTYKTIFNDGNHQTALAVTLGDNPEDKGTRQSDIRNK